MFSKLDPNEAEALEVEFAKLIRREPECNIDDVFDELACRRFGMMISRVVQDQTES